MALSGSTPKKYTGAGAFWTWVEWTATQNLENNTSTITAITYGGSNEYGYYSGTNRWGYTVIDGTTNSVKATSSWSASTSKKEICRQTKTVTHNPDGTKTVNIAGRWTAGSNPEGSFFNLYSSDNFTLDTIPRASTPTTNVSTAPLETAVVISTNRASSNFLHTLKYSIGNLSGTVASNIADSYSWTLPASLAAAITNSTSGTLTLILETYSNGVLLGTISIPLTVTVPNTATFKPGATINSVTEGETGLTAFTVRIQNKSKLRVQSSGTGKHGATISQYKVVIDNVTYYGADITSNTITKSGSIPVTLTVTDSRGYATSVTTNVTVIAYEAPQIITFNPRRTPTDQDANLTADVNFAISPVSNQNTKRYIIRYRKVGAPTWTEAVNSTAVYNLNTTLTYPGVLDPNFAYDVELVVSDSFATVSKLEPISTAFELFNYYPSGKGFAIGKVSEKDAFEVALPTEFNGVDVDLINGASYRLNGQVLPIPKRVLAYNYSSGVLIDTGQAPNANKFFYIRLTGNGFSNGIPVESVIQGYWFNSTPAFQYLRLLNLGLDLGVGSFLVHNGTIKIWLPISFNAYTSLNIDAYLYSELLPITITVTDAVKPTTGVTYDTPITKVQTGGTMSDADIKAAVLRVDGSGSNIDADMLDGKHASEFLTSLPVYNRGGDHLNGWEDLPNNLRRCWKTVTFTLAGTAFTATGPTGTYKTGWLTLGNWPSAFTAAPRLTNFTGTVTNGAWSWVGSIKEPTATAPGDFLMYKFANTATDLKVFVEAVGPR